MKLLMLILFCSSALFAEKNPYGLDLIGTIEEYRSSVRDNPKNELIEIGTAIPNITLDIRYATGNNFTSIPVYPYAAAFVRKEAADSLKKVQAELNEKGLGLKIFDAYRPYSVTLQFYEIAQDTNYVASPWYGSRHNRGCAVDLTLIDIITGKEVAMPTQYDDFTEKAHPTNFNLPVNIINNRQMLIDIMRKYGFSVYPTEWWHYDFKGWENYQLMDISFESLREN